MSTSFSNCTESAVHSRRMAHRRALILGLVAILFTIFTIPAQIGIFVTGSFYFYLSVASAVFAGISWIAALCFLTHARGYHPLWGLLLLFPPLILIYPFAFPDKSKG